MLLLKFDFLASANLGIRDCSFCAVYEKRIVNNFIQVFNRFLVIVTALK